MRLTPQTADQFSNVMMTVGMLILILTGNWFLSLTLSIGGISFIQGFSLNDSATLRMIGLFLIGLGLTSLLGVCTPIIMVGIFIFLLLALMAPQIHIS